MSAATEIHAPTATLSTPTWPGAATRVAVAVSTRDRSSYLAGLLAALEAQTLPRASFEVVVVDDGSRDDTWDVLERAAPTSKLRLFAARLDPARGPAAGRNLAVASSRAPVIAFTDDDCLPAPEWVEALLSSIDRGADVVQGRTEPSRGVARTSAWDRSVDIRDASGLFETCNIAYRREVFERAGGFEEPSLATADGSRPHFGEDVVLGWRVVRAGATVVFEPRAQVSHRWIPATYRTWLDERRRLVHFPGLVRRAPGFDAWLWRRVFLSRETAAFDLAIVSVGGASALRNPWLLLGAAPWVSMRWPEARRRRGRSPLFRLIQLAVADLVGVVALIRGSVRHRRLVL